MCHDCPHIYVDSLYHIPMLGENTKIQVSSCPVQRKTVNDYYAFVDICIVFFNLCLCLLSTEVTGQGSEAGGHLLWRREWFQPGN